MKTAITLCLLAWVSLQAAEPSYTITDGKSLKDGLDIYLEFRAGTRRVTWEETVRATEAATYLQAFAEACYMWQMKSPDEAPFSLPSDLLIFQQFAKIVHKYLSDHPDRLHERAEFLVFDALTSAFPRK